MKPLKDRHYRHAPTTISETWWLGLVMLLFWGGIIALFAYAFS